MGAALTCDRLVADYLIEEFQQEKPIFRFRNEIAIFTALLFFMIYHYFISYKQDRSVWFSLTLGALTYLGVYSFFNNYLMNQVQGERYDRLLKKCHTYHILN